MPKSNKRLYRSRKHRIITGLAGGVAEYFDIDPLIVRLVFFVSPFVSMGSAAVLYVLVSVFVPFEPVTKNSKKKK